MAPAGTPSAGGRGPGQSAFPRCGAVDPAHGSALAGPAAGLRRLEEHASAILPLAGQGGPMDEPDYAWLMGEPAGTAHRCKSHQGSSPCGRCARRKPGDGSHKRGLDTKLHLAVAAHGLPLRAIAAAGAAADCSQADVLIEGVDAGALLADRAHDTNRILAHCRRWGIEPVIPSKRNRKAQAKHAASFLAAIHIRCLMPWRDNS